MRADAKLGRRSAACVAAGWFRGGSDSVELHASPVPPDPRYPLSWQRAYEVRGNSVDRIARPGDFLIVVDRTAAGLAARSGDIIIVTRKKEGLQEVTARRFQQSGTDCVLTFDLTDLRYNRVSLPLRSLQRNSDQQETGSDVMGGIVIGVLSAAMIS